MTQAEPYKAISLDPFKAQALNALCARVLPLSFDLNGTACVLELDPWQTPFAPACTGGLLADGATWRIDFSNLELIRLHPAGAQALAAAQLPDALRLALLELALQPALAALGAVFNQAGPIAVTSDNLPDDTASSRQIPLRASFAGSGTALLVRTADQAAAQMVLERLLGFAPLAKPATEVPVSVGLEAGFMRLRVAEIGDLAVGDVFLPEHYPLQHGELLLRLTPDAAFRCAVDGNKAKVLDYVRSSPREVETMSDAIPQTPEKAGLEDSATENRPSEPGQTDSGAGPSGQSAPGPRLDDLEVTVAFELERRIMTVGELAALAPGYTFPLTADAAAPVTLRVNGKNLGAGRLVDLNGVLGVQVIDLNLTGKDG